MPHLLGPAGSPLPPSRNEVLLREALDRLRAQLDAARQVINVGRSHVRAEELDSSMAAATWSDLRDAIAAYDKVVKELTVQ
jgi:NAD(P)H-dependent FMN reductase